MDELNVLLDEVGPEKLQQAMRACVRECKFMPTIAEIRDKAGRNHEKLLAVETDLAWEFVVRYREIARKYVDADYDNEIPAYYIERPPVPARIEYAVMQCGGIEGIWKAVKDCNSSFVRRQFGEAFGNFVCSPGATDENLHPIRTLEDLENSLKPVRKDCPKNDRFMAEVEKHKKFRQGLRENFPQWAEKFPQWAGKTVDQSDPDSVPV